MLRVALSLVALLGLVSPPEATAQMTPADSAAVLLETARDFEARERWDVAEALYRLIAERYGSTAAATVARERLAAPPDALVYGSGRTEAQVWMSLYGAWLGVAIPAALGARSPESYGVGLLVGGPVGFLAGRGLANALDLTEGQARALTLGGTWGTWQGWGWREVFDFGVEERCETDPFYGGEFCYELEDASEEEFAAMVVGGLVGLGAGVLLSRLDVSAGTGTTVNFAALWGSWFGFAGGYLAGLEANDDLLASTLVVGNVGIVASALLAPRWNISRNRARMVSIAGVLGALAGGGVDLLAQPDSDRALVAIPLAGSLLGLGIGVLATRGDNGSRLGSLDPEGGALLGLRDGRLALGTPVPRPVLVPSMVRGGSGWRPALGLELFRASF